MKSFRIFSATGDNDVGAQFIARLSSQQLSRNKLHSYARNTRKLGADYLLLHFLELKTPKSPRRTFALSQ